MSNQKRGIRWAIFRIFGPQEVQMLVEMLDKQIDQTGADGIAIYPSGEYPFSVKTSMDDDLEPMIFPTPQERAAFHTGMEYGVGLMGGTTTALSKEDFQIIEQMSEKSTHGGGGSHNN